MKSSIKSFTILAPCPGDSKDSHISINEMELKTRNNNNANCLFSVYCETHVLKAWMYLISKHFMEIETKVSGGWLTSGSVIPKERVTIST